MLRFVLVLPALAIVSVAAAGHVQTLNAPKANLAKAYAPSPNGEPASIERQNDGLFYAYAEINGTPVRFIVDTGSSVVVLKPSDARRAGIAPTQGSRTRVETAGGPSTMRVTTIDRVRLAGQTLSDIDAAVVDGNIETSLLGQSVLAKLESVRIQGGTLRLN
jgi:aspartyl protease family protein